MRFVILVAIIAGMLLPHQVQAQYDYNDDFTKAVAVHYPPLVRLLITKGGTQNTQDVHGDSPIMLAIRSKDREVVELLLNYQPNLSLLNANNHSAATEAVLADDADSLKSVLVREDRLQVAESIGLATKLRRSRVLNRFVEIFGAPAIYETGHQFLKDSLPYFHVGSRVALAFFPAETLPDICGKPVSQLMLQGKICGVDGERVKVEWDRLSNLENDDNNCSSFKRLHWERKSDSVWNARFLGGCGTSPQYFTNVPSLFDYHQFLIPELR
jgi:hypothetical protein